MKAQLENIGSIQGNDSFVAYGFAVPFFEFRWHYHPEYELTLITGGHGKRIIGDSHESFSTGDLVLIGPELPHTWSSESFGPNESSAVVIQFSIDFISKFASLHECREINSLLASANCGSFFHEPNPGLLEKMIALPAKKSLERITALLEILKELSAHESIALSSPVYSVARSTQGAHRINKVCRYVQENAAREVSLEVAASKISLSKSAFCKFFRRFMNTAFSDYVNEIRIANACLMLAESDKTVREIASNCGFETLTYFNRVFLKKKGKTPVAFRKSLA